MAGCAYGFAPFRSAHLAHLELLLAWWMPLALLAAHWWLERGAAARWRCWPHGCGTGAVYRVLLADAGVAAGAVGLWFAAGRVPARQFAELGVAAMLGVAALAPLLLHYWRVHDALGLYRRPR